MNYLKLITLEERIVLDGAAVAGVIYVDIQSTAPAPDGSSWATAYADLQSALNAAADNILHPGEDTIWVADGVYRPSTLTVAGTPQSTTFTVSSSITILGGFEGIGGINPDLRQPSVFKTIFDGDLGQNDSPGVISSKVDNSWHVMTQTARNLFVTLDGLTIQNGFASAHGVGATDLDLRGGGYQKDLGGALDLTLLTLNNVVMQDNMVYRSASLTTRNPTFSRGGAIQFGGGGSLSIYDSIFQNNESTSDVTNRGNGGAIWTNLATVDIQRTSFINNHTSAHFAGIDLSNNFSAQIIDSEFIGNVAGTRGGAVGWLPVNGGSTILVEGTLFDHNRAGSGIAGALYFDGGALAAVFNGAVGTVRDSVFTYNSNELGVGGAFGAGGARTIIENSVFAHNSAAAGGAVAMYALDLFAPVFPPGTPPPHMLFTVRDSSFTDNIATGVPSVGFTPPPELSLAGGGAMFIAGGAEVTVERSTFKMNVAPNGGAISVVGYRHNNISGALIIPVDTGGILHVYDSLFQENRAIKTTFPTTQVTGDGGAIISKGWLFTDRPGYGATSVDIHGSTFLKNYAERSGGAIASANNSSSNLLIPGALSVSNSSFQLNYTASVGGMHGGAIAAENTSANIEGSNFLANSATLNGGAVAAQNVALTILDSNFLINHANGAGGAIWALNGTLNISKDLTIPDNPNNLFSLNCADLRGGAIAAENVALTLTYSDFLGNYSKLSGGAVSAIGGSVNVSYGLFSLNLAGLNGGALAVDNAALNANHNIFLGNFAKINGGTIALLNSTADINLNMFALNDASKKGDHIYSDDSTINGKVTSAEIIASLKKNNTFLFLFNNGIVIE